MTHALAELIVNTTANNPSLVPNLVILFVLASAINHGLRAVWPFACMPTWARFVVGVCAPFALNFYDIGRRATRAEKESCE